MNSVPHTIGGYPMDQFVPLFTAIIAMMATLLGVWINSRGTDRQLRIKLEHERRTDLRNTRREKLEELYLLTKGLIDFMELKYASARLAIDRNLPKEIYMKTLPPQPDPLPRMAVIVNLYFYNIFDAFSPVAKSMGGLNRIMMYLEESYAERLPTRIAEISKDLEDLHTRALGQLHEFEKAIFSMSDPDLRTQV